MNIHTVYHQRHANINVDKKNLKLSKLFLDILMIDLKIGLAFLAQAQDDQCPRL